MLVSSYFVRALVEILERDHRIEGRRFLSDAGFDPARLDKIDDRISQTEGERLVERALALSGNPALGLRVGLTATSLTTGLYSFGVLQAMSLREGLKFADEFHGLSTDEPPLNVEIGVRDIVIRGTGVLCAVKHRQFAAETMVAGLYVMLKTFVPNARPKRVAFEHPAPPHRDEYARIFQGKERFEQPFTGMVISSDLLDVRPWQHDEELHSILRRQAAKKVAGLKQGASFSDKVRDYVTAMPGRPHEMASVARAFGMSPRSLRRRLFEEGATFRSVVEPALASLAMHLLGDEGRSIQDAAKDLAFSETSAFSRAFKRWTGLTPKQCQSVHRKDAPRKATGE